MGSYHVRTGRYRKRVITLRLALLTTFSLAVPIAQGSGGDECSTAPVTTVSVGPPGSPALTILSGDNTPATCDTANCPPGTELGWYEAFEIETCARVTIDFCGQDPVSRPAFAAVWNTCPFDSAVLADSFSRAAPCTDFNFWMQFDELAAGTYWYQISTVPGDKRCENGAPATCQSNADCPPPYTCQDNIHPYTINITAEALPARRSASSSAEKEAVVEETLLRAGLSAGPDVIISEVFGCEVLGRVGPVNAGTVGMSCGTTACNVGTGSTDWSPLPDVNHPMISMSLYRLGALPGQGGADRLVQLGRSWLKHGYFAENTNECDLGCDPRCIGGSKAGMPCRFDHDCPGGACEGETDRLAPACGDTYVAQQFVPCDLGPRSMIHPFTGVMPPFEDLGPSPGCVPQGLETTSAPANDHRDHVHTPISHRLQVQEVDLDHNQNPGALYFAEAQYIVPAEFVSGNGNQHNNVSHRRVNVAGDPTCGGIFFENVGGTFTEQPAMRTWPGSARSLIEPAPLVDGRGFLVYKVTDLGGGSWHYEYALYNMNLDRALGSLSIPVSGNAAISNVGFYAPQHHAPEPHADNYSNTPWTVSIDEGAITWSTESFDVNPLANAVRFGSLYNFWFNANVPPQEASATIELFKTGGSVSAAVLAPFSGVEPPSTPLADPTGINKSRFLSFSVTGHPPVTAVRVRLVSLHHVVPPYAVGPSTPFTSFEGQARWVGPPVQYVESTATGTLFRAATLQCTPHYQDWTTVGLLHVTGSAVVPSSLYEVETLTAACMGTEETCTSVSQRLAVTTTRWTDVEVPYNPPSTTAQPDVGDISALVNKFRSAAGAPIKARALLAGTDQFGNIHIAPDLSFAHIAACVDAFRGQGYPFTISTCP